MTENTTSDAVDVHAHIVPPALLTELAETRHCGFAARRTEAGWVVSVPGSGDTRPIRPRMTETGPRRAWLAEQGIGRQVLSPWLDIQSGAFTDAGQARDWARRLNDAMCSAAAEFGTVALASVALGDAETAATDLTEALRAEELAGLILTTDPAEGPALHEPHWDPLWSVAAAAGIPVMLHPPTCGPSAALSSIGELGNVHGRLVDNTIAVSQLLLHGVLDRHPDLRIQLVHGGGYLPYQAARLDGGYRTGEAKVGDLARGLPSAYLPAMHYDTVGLSAPAIRFLAELVGPERVLLGSDFPFALGDPHPVRTAKSAGLDIAALRDTAIELFPRLLARRTA
ncbi:MAG TPA: amidohydrolase family protein [Pseudonocardiaceae bacterium]|nr:amidohydrolase family protein [Pseudonocardiaceae bacterium]